MKFLEMGWPALLAHGSILQMSDFMIFYTKTEDKQLNTTLVGGIFSGFKITIHTWVSTRSHTGYDRSIAKSLVWFLRLGYTSEPRRSYTKRDLSCAKDKGRKYRRNIYGLLRSTLTGNRHCRGRKIHTDFLAFCPIAISIESFANTKEVNAEKSATKAFAPIIERGKGSWVPGAGPHLRRCRIRGESSPVIHVHDFDTIYPACLLWLT